MARKNVKRTALTILAAIVLLAGVTLGAFYGVAVKGDDFVLEYVKGMNLEAADYEVPSFSRDPETGFFEMEKKDGDFTVLQITDPHVGGGWECRKNDAKTFDTMLRVIRHVRPDMIIVTGDVVYPFSLQTGNVNNEKPARAVIAFFESLGIPWTITIGNHENSGETVLDRGEFAELFEDKNLRHCMFSANPVGERLSGYGNGAIIVRNPDGTVNNVLFLFDSHNTVSAGRYDKIHDDQVEWYERTVRRLSVPENGVPEGEVVKSLAFFHIPTEEYDTAKKLYDAGSPEVKYLYGEWGEKILCHHTTKRQPKGRFFDAALRLGSTKGMFCGHDHKNNAAVVYRGIQLTFGSSTVYNGLFGIARDDTYRGGTVITIKDDGTFSSRNVLDREIRRSQKSGT